MIPVYANPPPDCIDWWYPTGTGFIRASERADGVKLLGYVERLPNPRPAFADETRYHARIGSDWHPAPFPGPEAARAWVDARLQESP